MDRHAAVTYLHRRHPTVIDAPARPVDREQLGLQCFWFQAHVCELVDDRAERAVRRCFETAGHLLVAGDDEVQGALAHSFLQPHLFALRDFDWAAARMPAPLAHMARVIRRYCLRQLRTLGREKAEADDDDPSGGTDGR